MVCALCITTAAGGLGQLVAQTMMMTIIIVYSPLLFLIKINLDECVGNQKNIDVFSWIRICNSFLRPFPFRSENDGLDCCKDIEFTGTIKESWYDDPLKR